MNIYITNYDLVIKATPALSLLNNFLVHGSPIHTKCGGKAICGCCRVQIISGQQAMSKPNTFEQEKLGTDLIQQGWRLSCQSHAFRDIEIFMPREKDLDDFCAS